MSIIHQLYRTQSLNLTVEQAWEFFSSPYNLNDITPDFFHVDIKSSVPEAIYPGLLIAYGMKAVGGITMTWLSEITQMEHCRYFIYQQKEGPFKFWSHEVRITALESGITMEDIVFYTMPFGPLGELMHRFMIHQKLEKIFDTRQDFLQSRWDLAPASHLP